MDKFMISIPYPQCPFTSNKGDVGGVPGYWVKPSSPKPSVVMLYVHGGGYRSGTAKAYCPLAAHFATRVNVCAFLPDYRLAPEHTFPAAVEDGQTVLQGLVEMGYSQVVVVGDSAGGGLSLSLLCSSPEAHVICAAVLMSPWTDLSLTNSSITLRATADIVLTAKMLSNCAVFYLGSHDPLNPLASPLYADFSQLPPLQVHVGDREILLDDSLKLEERAKPAGVEVDIHVWKGMGHAFPYMLGKLQAADAALDMMVTFLSDRL